MAGSKQPFGLLEIFITFALLTGFSFLISFILKQKVFHERVAEVKMAQRMAQTHAEQAIQRFISSAELESAIASDPQVSACFR